MKISSTIWHYIVRKYIDIYWNFLHIISMYVWGQANNLQGNRIETQVSQPVFQELKYPFLPVNSPANRTIHNNHVIVTQNTNF
jgi:hypothetical protein